MKRRDEYDIIYDYDEEDSRNYEELSETNEDEKIEKLRGKSVHEDLYYRWAAGYDVYLDE